MNEQKILNGLKSVRSHFTWEAVLFGLMFLSYHFLFNIPYEKSRWIFYIAFGCLIARTTLSAFIDGYEKKI